MFGQPSPEVQSALQLVRRGRFSDALTLLQQQLTKRVASPRQKDLLACAILADALQRTGHNHEAESIARDNVRKPEECSELNARFHFVLGNVLRERGDIAAAVKHIQIAATQASTNHEFSCWAHLRLLTAVA